MKHIAFSEYSVGTDIEKKYAPKDLYYMGNFSLLTTGKRVSVVGSRNASDKGLKRAEIITKELVNRNELSLVRFKLLEDCHIPPCLNIFFVSDGYSVD